MTPSRRRKSPQQLFFLFLVFLCLSLTQSFAEPVQFVVVHTSDMHGRVSPQPDALATSDPRPMIGGFAAMATFLKQERRDSFQYGKLVVTLDGGDVFQGTPIVEETQGLCMVELMNAARYWGGTLGNHDFDYGYDQLKKVFSQARYPIICCNVFEKKSGKLLPFTRPYILIPFKGKTLAITGVLTPETRAISFEKNVRDIEFKDPVKAVQALVPILKERGADCIILLSHMGIADDRMMAPQLPGVDLILGGHSHTTMTDIEYPGENAAAIVHPGCDGRTLSKVEITLENGQKPVFSYTSVYLDTARYPPDPEMAKVVARVEEKINRVWKTPIGTSTVELVRGIIGGDSPEGSFVADAMREYSDADFAFINSGGLRCPILPGGITREDIFFLQPFNNTIEVLHLTGKQLTELIEQSLSVPFMTATQEDVNYAVTNFRLTCKGLKRDMGGTFGYVFPSNLHITFDPSLPPMKRIVKMTDGKGKPLIPEKTYSVAFNNYLSEGGDGFKILKMTKNRHPYKTLMRDVVIEKIEKDRGITSMPEQRMFNLKLETAPVH